jgi:proline iminopeptidase
LKYPHSVKKLILADTLYDGAMWQAKNDNVDREIENQYPETWQRIQHLRDQGLHSSAPQVQEADDTPYGLAWFYNPDNAAKLHHDPVSSNPEVAVAIAGDDNEGLLGGEATGIDFRSRLKDIQAPTLIIAGRFDRVFVPRNSILFKRYMPQAKFVFFEKSGHYPQIEETDKFFSTVEDFLKGQ